MLAFVFYLLSAFVIYTDADWWIKGLICLPTCFWATGWGWAKVLRRSQATDLLQLIIEASWIGISLTWLNIFILREIGFGIHDSREWILWLMSVSVGGIGLYFSKDVQQPLFLPKREKIGLVSLAIGLIFLSQWKSADIQRPLDGYWYKEGAAAETNVYVPLEPSRNWSSRERIGWEDAGAWKLIPSGKNPDLVARERVNGRVTIAVRGPIGSFIEAGGQRAEVSRSMIEFPEEGPVRRYLTRGVAAISVWVDLQPGEFFGLDIEGEEVYLMTSSEAVWALHATGTLRYFIYYQLLNQVENQVWAEEILENRRFTWNQPGGWSPLLSTAVIYGVPDLPSAAILFLLVLALLGMSTLRLASVAAPSAPSVAWGIPAALVVVHGLLMFEPGSINFPDSLYAVSIVCVVTSLLQGDLKSFTGMGVWAQALRWPGSVVALIFLFLTNRLKELSWVPYARNLGVAVLLGIGCAGLASLSGDAEDLLFILYFETIPEHWHGEFGPLELLSRMPSFYGHWIMYTGGSLLLCLPFLLGRTNNSRTNLRVILGGAIAYSLMLSTIDHHPSHYFLPLVALTGPAICCAISTLPSNNSRQALAITSLFGIGLYLWTGIV